MSNNNSVNQQQPGGDGGGGKNQNQNQNQNQKKRFGYGRRGKRVVLSGIKPPAKKDKENRGGSIGCCVCVKRMAKLDSCTESPTSDPNSSDFTLDSLRDLIENSDFFLKECNTHFD